MKLGTVSGSHNPADIGTKRLPAARLRSLMRVLGMYDLKCGSGEGADDPGGLSKKRQSVIPVLSDLSLLQAQGCQNNSEHSRSSSVSFILIVFMVMIGFGIAVLFMWANRPRAVREEREPDAEPEASDPTSTAEIGAPAAASSSHDLQPAASSSHAPRQPIG